MGLKPAANSIKVLDVTILGAWGRKQGFLGFLCRVLQFGEEGLMASSFD